MAETTLHRVRGVEVVLRRAGRGQPLLVLHGGRGPDTVGPIIDRLAGGHDVLAPTHPGWDGTVRPDRLDSVDALADLYLALLDDLGLQDATVLGSSFGGWIGAEMSVRDDTGRVGRLVLIDAIGPSVQGHLPEPDPGEPQEDLPDVARSGLDALQAYTGPSMQDPGLLARLATVTVPALVLWGENDPILPVTFGRAYAEAIPGARFVVVEGAGHLPTSEAPEPTFAVIDDFLRSHRSGVGTEANR